MLDLMNILSAGNKTTFNETWVGQEEARGPDYLLMAVRLWDMGKGAGGV